MLVFWFAWAPSIQTCSSITNSPVTRLSGACGTTLMPSPSLMICVDTAQCVLCRRVNEAQPRLPSSSSCFGYSSMSVYISAWITRKGGGYGFSWQRARLWKLTGANVPLLPCWSLGQGVPLQGEHSLATGQQPALPRIFAWETTAHSCPGQVQRYVNVVLFLRSHVSIVENRFPFGLILPLLYLFS